MRRRSELEGLGTEELLAKGIAAARIDDRVEARRLLLEVTERDPDAADGWLWLASVEGNPRTKRDHFQRVLQLRPGDVEAKAGLEGLAEKYGTSLLEADAAPTMTCARHPDRETLLTCTRCGRPMCTACAVRHPVGMRCKDCARELRAPMYAVSPAGLVRALVVALAGGAAGGVVMLLLSGIGGFLIWMIAFFLGPAAGTAIADATSRAAGRKRGRAVIVLVVAGMILGVWLPHAVLAALPPRGFAPAAAPFADAWLLRSISGSFNIQSLIYLFTGISAAAARLR